MKKVPVLEFSYTNWKGEFGRRRVHPIRWYHGSTEWHPEPQWLMKAYDTDKKEIRVFAVKDMVFSPDQDADATQTTLSPRDLASIVADQNDILFEAVAGLESIATVIGCEGTLPSVLDALSSMGAYVDRLHVKLGGVHAALTVAGVTTMDGDRVLDIDERVRILAEERDRAQESASGIPKESPLPGPSVPGAEQEGALSAESALSEALLYLPDANCTSPAVAAWHRRYASVIKAAAAAHGLGHVLSTPLSGEGTEYQRIVSAEEAYSPEEDEAVPSKPAQRPSVDQLMQVLKEVPEWHDQTCAAGPHDADAKCNCWVSRKRAVLSVGGEG